jgi:release factor glutamine methyltransferase
MDKPRLDSVVERLREAGCVAAEDEAAELAAAVSDSETLEEWLCRRERGEPLAWITGRVRFCNRILCIDPGVYVPRPQTQELARRAVRSLGSGRAADLCTGGGAIACVLKAEAPGASVVGVDIDPRAVACARRNGVSVILGDLAEALAPRSFDVVTAVAPYVPTASLAVLPRDVLHYEPLTALDGGEDGLDVLRRVVTSASRILRPGGRMLIELGAEQDALLAPALEAAGFSSHASWSDHDGDLRGLMAERC